MSRAWGTPDISVPSVARVWDHLLEGKNAFAADRTAVDEMCEAFPGWPRLASMQRRFVGRAVEYLVGDVGVQQLIDVGCGFPLPRQLAVHEIAQLTDPDARVIYVDNDASVFRHSLALVSDDRTSASIHADVTKPLAILQHPVTRRLLDLDQPYAVLLCGVLHHLADEQNPAAVVEHLRDAMPPGSYLVVSNLLGGDDPVAEEAERAWDKTMQVTGRFRTWAEQMPYFAGLDPIPPGFVYADDWRPDDITPETSPEHTLLCAGVSRIPGRPS